MFKSFLSGMFLLLFTISSLAAEKAQYEIKWVLAHEPARVFEKAANEFAKRISAKTNGAIAVKVITESQDGQKLTPIMAFTKVQNGEIQMSQTYSTFLGNYNKNLWILDLPFIFKNHEHAAKVLDGKIGAQLLSGLDKASVKGLAFTYSGGFRIIPTSKKALKTAEDFKHQEIGVAKDSPVAQSYLKELGATPVLMSDDSINVKNGDGFETTYARFSNFDNSKMKYLNETEHTLFLTSILINKKFFDSLPVDFQKAIQETALEVAQFERNESIQDNLTSKSKFIKDYNMVLVKMDESEKLKMKKAADKIYTKYNKVLDQKIIANIKNTP